MEPLEIIKKYYDLESKAYKILVEHGEAVKKKALEIAQGVPEMNLNLQFITAAAMLHDIGMFLTHAPEIGCHGDELYIRHGILGRDILEKEDLPKHALVCERHVGVGISEQDIDNQELPLPARDMRPVTPEEKLICLADKFYSKDIGQLSTEKSPEQIKSQLQERDPRQVDQFNELCRDFKVENN